jgi:hypothetical protein
VVATQIPMQQLELVKEAKIFDIVEGSLNPRLEASGVLAKDGLFYVIFDNLPHVACIGPELSRAARDNHMIIQEKGYRRGFEDIAYDPWPGRFYILIESLPRGRAKFMAAVQEYDATFGYIDSAWLDFPLDRPNKGLEGLTCVRREEQTYLLGLCEGNRCKGGAEGRIPGGGRIQVFQRGRRNWDRVGKIRLPETVLFEDYSGIAVTGDRIAVISQVSSALWLGSLAPSGWQITGAGTSYALPRASDGSIAYGTIEGVSWIAPDQVVMVSDKAKPEQDRRCRAKDQSIHIFRIPSPVRPLDPAWQGPLAGTGPGHAGPSRAEDQHQAVRRGHRDQDRVGTRKRQDGLSALHSGGARAVISYPVQYLDGAIAAVDPDPVAAVQEHGGVAAPDDGGDAEFAGHDRGVGEWRADVGYDRGGAGEDRRPADVGHRGDEDLAVTELGGVLEC